MAAEENKKNLSAFQYLERLQQEFIVAELRHKIYTYEKDKKYWSKVMKGKESIINQISKRNLLPNIFNNEELKNKIYSTIVTEFGLPHFVYKDSKQYEDLVKIDIQLYYRKGSEVRYKSPNNTTELGIIKSFNLQAKLVEVEPMNQKGNPLFVEADKVSRIL